MGFRLGVELHKRLICTCKSLQNKAPIRSFLGLARDRRGVGAVEFAILAPILLMVYIGVFELTVGYSTYKRVTRAAGTIADLLTRKASTSKLELQQMPEVASSLLAPYSLEGLKIQITGIKIDNNLAPKVAWSWAEDGTKPFVVNSTATVPTAYLKPDSFLVRAKVSIPHELLMFMPTILMEERDITISQQSIFPLRNGAATLPCSGC
ncbi:pilus assembly protein [Rhizobiaceae bacterium n13]|uniref:Pilus assembly protein n=1 Tax=Ferirhizobium litorale TaxID=2927786 RepID=A0AAE3QIR2_9HYPH|nr:TadE/TadG family type IV pilus assembly protein [Fererhizobium litorale]MDI7862825.1 pilus assembly protein [Fererhizobium litorale]MDI7923929.1 pilus assembly protein [Fererhizobium litorale]